VSPTAAVARAHGRATGTSLPGNELAAGAARRFLRAALAEWADPYFADRVMDDGTLLVSELVTNAVVHAGTAVELVCRLDPAESALVLEVTDRHPARALRGDRAAAGPGDPGSGTLTSADVAHDLANDRAEGGRGLYLVATLADTWGVTYRRDRKTVWCRIALTGEPEPEARIPAQLLAPSLPSLPRRADPDWGGHGPLSFLAEASDLLAGQLDEDNVASLATQLLVPRLADWCAVWLHPGGNRPRLAHVWHSAEHHIDGLRAALEQAPPAPSDRPGAQPYPWPRDAGVALAVPLIATGRCHGTLLLGAAPARGGLPDGALGLIEDFARRVALALGTARQYARQAMISTVLQRGLLPPATGRIPGVEHAVVYEPTGGDWVGGDFYDLFPAGDGRWCFALGDVCGSGPEAASLAGIARPVLRLLAREGCGVSDVLDRLNKALADEAATALLAETAAWEGQARFLSLLYGEITPGAPGPGAQVTLASAGHPLPLLLAPDGTVRPAATPQMLLGISDDARYASESFVLAPGDTLLCVTDGVTERRHAGRQFDDDDGLAAVLRGCTGLPAAGVAETLRKAVHDFDETPPADDLALLVLQAL